MMTVSNSRPLARNSVMTFTFVIASSADVTKRTASSSCSACQSSMSPPVACARSSARKSSTAAKSTASSIVAGPPSASHAPRTRSAMSTRPCSPNAGARTFAMRATRARPSSDSPSIVSSRLKRLARPHSQVLAHREQVREHEPAPRCAQHRERGEPIGGLQQRVREAQEVEDRLARAERVELDCREGNARCAQRRQDLVEIAARAHQDRDVLRPGRNGAVARAATTRAASSRAVRRRPRAWAVRRRTRVRLRRGRERDGAAPRLVALAEDAREHAVGPCHQMRLRAEVAREVDELRPGRCRCILWRAPRGTGALPRRGTCRSTASDRRPRRACGRRPASSLP